MANQSHYNDGGEETGETSWRTPTAAMDTEVRGRTGESTSPWARRENTRRTENGQEMAQAHSNLRRTHNDQTSWKRKEGRCIKNEACKIHRMPQPIWKCSWDDGRGSYRWKLLSFVAREWEMGAIGGQLERSTVGRKGLREETTRGDSTTSGSSTAAASRGRSAKPWCRWRSKSSTRQRRSWRTGRRGCRVSRTRREDWRTKCKHADQAWKHKGVASQTWALEQIRKDSWVSWMYLDSQRSWFSAGRT